VRLGFRELGPDLGDAVGFAAGNHVRLGVDKSDHSVAKQRVFVRDKDACFRDLLSRDDPA
jgi:hypothetical protein